ncbi:MAG: flagellar biosynthesis anti-sigma factor FlgM [Pseudomonadota bacterium]
MPSFELSKLQGISGARALSDSDRTQLDANRRASAPASETSAGKPSAGPGVAIEVGVAVDPSTPPINNDRVEKIRKALEDGTYPLVPTQIADAIIAARVGFGVDAR